MGRPKLQLPIGDTTVVGAVVRALRDAGVDPVVLVVSPEHAALREWAEREGLLVAVNPKPEGGMLTSIWCGLDQLEADAEENAETRGPLLISPADLPCLQSETVRQLLAAVERESTSLVMPVFDCQRGHPLVVPWAHVEKIRSLDPAVGLKQLREQCTVVKVAVDDPGVVADVDTPEDYERARAGKGPAE